MSQNKEPLRIGVMLDSWRVEAWTARMLEIISQSSYANIELLIFNADPQFAGGILNRLRENAGRWLYRLYMRLERLVCRPRPSAFESVDLKQLLGDVASMTVMPRRKRRCDFFPADAVSQLKSHDLDVIIRSGFGLLKGDVLTSARMGVWSYHHGDNRVLRGGPSGFWEVFKGWPVTGSILQILTEKIDDGTILARSWSSTNLFSVVNNRNKYFWKSMMILPRKLEELYRFGPEEFLERVEPLNDRLFFYDNRMFRPPSNCQFVSAFFAHMWRSASRVAYRLVFREQWHLMFRKAADISTSFWLYKTLNLEGDCLRADPFVIEEEGRYYVFFEEVPAKSGKGHIAVAVLDGEGALIETRKVLERPWHIAYPCVFDWNGQRYMAPDSSANGSVDLYRCESFPDKWVFDKTLIANIQAADPTLFEYSGKWWMFASVKEHSATSYWDEVSLYYADSPLSDDWMPHPANPVVSDARKARPAGGIIKREGRIYRVSQNCTRGYGYGMNLHEITALDENRYSEKDVCSMEPNWDSSVTGLHTLGWCGGLTVIDVRRRSPRIPFLSRLGAGGHK